MIIRAKGFCCYPGRLGLGIREENRTTFRCATISASAMARSWPAASRSEEHTSELQSHSDLVCRLLLEKKKKKVIQSEYIQPHKRTEHKDKNENREYCGMEDDEGNHRHLHKTLKSTTSGSCFERNR